MRRTLGRPMRTREESDVSCPSRRRRRSARSRPRRRRARAPRGARPARSPCGRSSRAGGAARSSCCPGPAVRVSERLPTHSLQTKVTGAGTYVVDGPAAAAAADPGRARALRRGEVHLLPRVLVAADDDARGVAVQEQQRRLRRGVAEEPARAACVSGRGQRGAGKAEAGRRTSPRA